MKYGKYLTLFTLLLLASCTKDDIDYSYCQCVEYVKNELGIPSTTGTADAWAWGLNILPNGFYATTQPQAGDILVMAKNYNGASLLYGHIAIVKQCFTNSEGYTVIIQGANHKLENEYEQCGCINVSELEKAITYDDITSQKAKFFRNDNFSYKCFTGYN
jgi:surface antigen